MQWGVSLVVPYIRLLACFEDGCFYCFLQAPAKLWKPPPCFSHLNRHGYGCRPSSFWIQIITAGKGCHVYDTNSTFRGSSSADNYPLIFQSSLSLSPYLLPPPYLAFVILSLWSVKLYFMPMVFLAFFENMKAGKMRCFIFHPWINPVTSCDRIYILIINNAYS